MRCFAQVGFYRNNHEQIVIIQFAPDALAPLLSFSSFDYFCIDSSNRFPVSVSRYFCVGLLGESG